MASRYEEILSNRKNNRVVKRSEGGFAVKRPTRTKPGDHLSWLVIRARDGKWDDLVEYINSDEPLTPQGRAAVALLLKEFLERRHGGPSGTPTDEQEAIEVAVWFMCAARDIFTDRYGRERLNGDEIKELARVTAAKTSAEFSKLKAPLEADDLIGSPGASKKSPYRVGPTKHAEYLVCRELRFAARPIVDELVEALAVFTGNKPVKV